MNSPIALVTAKTDADYAADLKRRLIEAYKPVNILLDEATANSFLVQVNTGPDAFGKQTITGLLVAKKF